MYLVYTDESGDDGLAAGGSAHYVISAAIIHETNWNAMFENIVTLRRQLRADFHGTDMAFGHGDFHHVRYGLSTSDRFEMYRRILEFVASQVDLIRFIHVFILKNNILNRNLSVFEWAWKYLIQRVHNTIAVGGELHRGDDHALLLTDRTHDDHLRAILREMRAHNPVPNMGGVGTRNILVDRLLDDPSPRNSKHSYFVQLADLAAYALARRDFPSPKLAPFNFETYFDVLTPVLVKSAAGGNPQGIYYWPT